MWRYNTHIMYIIILGCNAVVHVHLYILQDIIFKISAVLDVTRTCTCA